jgi:hypothetical protein
MRGPVADPAESTSRRRAVALSLITASLGHAPCLWPSQTYRRKQRGDASSALAGDTIDLPSHGFRSSSRRVNDLQFRPGSLSAGSPPLQLTRAADLGGESPLLIRKGPVGAREVGDEKPGALPRRVMASPTRTDPATGERRIGNVLRRRLRLCGLEASIGATRRGSLMSTAQRAGAGWV